MELEMALSTLSGQVTKEPTDGALPTATPTPLPLTPAVRPSSAPTVRRLTPVLLTMREGKDGGGKGPLLSEDMSLTMGTSPTQTLFDGPSVRRLTPVECERLMGWPDGWTIVAGWTSRSASTPTATDAAGTAS